MDAQGTGPGSTESYISRALFSKFPTILRKISRLWEYGLSRTEMFCDEDYFVIDRGFNDDPYSGLTYEDAQEEWLFTFYPSTQLTMVIDRPSGYLYLTRGSIPQ